jgi:hypothetical protein
MHIDRLQSPDVIERIGIVIWKIAMLVIALRCILALIQQQGVLDGLRGIGGMALQGSALCTSARPGFLVLVPIQGDAPWRAPSEMQRSPLHSLRRTAYST